MTMNGVIRRAVRVDEIQAMTREPTSEMIGRLAVGRGERVLELAAGPGHRGPEWADLVGPEGTVLLTDIAPAMIGAATARNASSANIDALVMDAARRTAGELASQYVTVDGVGLPGRALLVHGHRG